MYSATQLLNHLKVELYNRINSWNYHETLETVITKS